MAMKKKLSEKLFDTANMLFLILLVFVTLYPFIHVLMTSLSIPIKLSGYYGFMLLPRGFSLDAYNGVFKNPMIIRSFLNSLLFVVTGTFLTIFLTAMGGYVLSRRGLYFKGFITIMIVIPMYFSGGLIPLYLLVNKMHMIDTLWAIILPGAIGTYNLILMRTNIQQVPVEMEESAKIDGASNMLILFIIILPLCLPIIAMFTLFQAVGIWNSWFQPAIFLTKRELFPLQLILREFLIEDKPSASLMGTANGPLKLLQGQTIKSAIVIISIVPVICVYPFLQKYFTKGVLVGAIKG